MMGMDAISASDVKGLYQLLDLVSDPEKIKKVVASMKAESDRLDAATKKHEAARADAEKAALEVARTQAASEANQIGMARDLRERSQKLDEEAKALAVRRRVLTDEQNELANQKAAHEERIQKHLASGMALDKRKRSLDNVEEHLSIREHALNAREAEVERKAQALRDVAGKL